MTPEGESGRGIGRSWDVRHVEATDSTNADVAALARCGAPEGIVMVADYQRAGRGRRGRTWTAPPGCALLASALLRPSLAPSMAPVVVLAAGLAAVEACEEVAGVFPSLKWPNDVVVEATAGAPGTAKLAGLLAESLVAGDRLAAVVVGMGVNLRRATVDSGRRPTSPRLFHPPAPPDAAHLENLAGGTVDGDALLRAWLAHLDHWRRALEAPGGEPAMVEAYRHRCTTLGQVVRVELAGGCVEGRALDVTEGGHLLVATVTGRQEIAAGDVVHLRPSS